MTERELKLLLNANALKQIQVHYAVMAQGYMIVADGKPLETSKRETRGIQNAGYRRKVSVQGWRGEFCGEAKDGCRLKRHGTTTRNRQ